MMLVALLLLSAPPSTSLLIWGGGAKPVDGDKALAEFATLAPAQLRGAQPLVVHSDDVPGLNKGFFVAIVGVCAPAKAGALVARLRDVKDGVYLRRVPTKTLPAALAKKPCPTWQAPTKKQRAQSLVDAGVTGDYVGDVEVKKGQRWQAYDNVVTDEARDGSSSTTTTTTTWVRQTSVGVIVLLTLETDRQSSNAECDRHISVAGPDVADDGSGDLVFVRTDEDGCRAINFDGDPDFDAAEAKKPIVTTERWSGAGDGYLKK